MARIYNNIIATRILMFCTVLQLTTAKSWGGQYLNGPLQLRSRSEPLPVVCAYDSTIAIL